GPVGNARRHGQLLASRIALPLGPRGRPLALHRARSERGHFLLRVPWFIVRDMHGAAGVSDRGSVSAYVLPFIGREEDRFRLERALLDGTRLLTLVGPSGIGKSRLAAAGQAPAGPRQRRVRRAAGRAAHRRPAGP